MSQDSTCIGVKNREIIQNWKDRALFMLRRGSHDPRNHIQHGNIVLHKYKVVYFFIPKVACSSIKRYCAEQLGIDRSDRDTHQLSFPSLRMSEIQKYKHYFKFGMVRNPWDRLVSCYRNKIKDDASVQCSPYDKGVFRYWNRYNAFYAGMPFDEFVDVICRIPDKDAEQHFKSQHTFMRDEHGDIATDYVGRFETLQESFDTICSRAKMPHKALGHLTKSRRGKYQEYYNDKLRDLVAERYSEDIKLYGYQY